MRIWETTLTGRKPLAALAARAAGAVQRFVREDAQGALVLCERGTAPRGVRETRVKRLFSAGRAGPGVGRWLFRVGIWMPKDWRAEMLAWYAYEHGPILLECRDWRGFQVCEAPAARGCQLWVLHYLAERAALDSEWRRRSRATPWFRRLARNAWFDGPFKRMLYRRA